MMEYIQDWSNLIRVGLTALIGFPLIWVISNMIQKAVQRKVSKHVSIIIGKAFFYTLLIFLLTNILNELGFRLSALLGAAGIVGLAIGFAAQTSVSNIISGIFLVLERSFTIGDIITYQGMTGTVETIELFAIRLRTFDGRLVRIPNEAIIKTTLINTTYFSKKRLDYKIRITSKQDIAQTMQKLNTIAQKFDRVLSDPAPLVFLNDVTYISVNLQLRVWTHTEGFAKTDWDFRLFLKEHLDSAGIEQTGIARIN